MRIGVGEAGGMRGGGPTVQTCSTNTVWLQTGSSVSLNETPERKSSTLVYMYYNLSFNIYSTSFWPSSIQWTKSEKRKQKQKKVLPKPTILYWLTPLIDYWLVYYILYYIIVKNFRHSFLKIKMMSSDTFFFFLSDQLKTFKDIQFTVILTQQINISSHR